VYYIHGGGNLTLAMAMRLMREDSIDLVQGLYALCPVIAGTWPLDANPSSVENNGIFMDMHHNRSAMAYGIEELEAKNPLAWPDISRETTRSIADFCKGTTRQT
jgi:acetyl esterase